MTVTTSDNDHTQDALHIPGSSTHDSESQFDDDNASEDSFGSDFGDDVTEEEYLTTDAGIEPDLPPAYPDALEPATTLIPYNVDMKTPVILEYTPPTSSQPSLNATSLGPSSPSYRMCAVCKILPAYNRGGASYPTCGFTCASKLRNAPESSKTLNVLPETPVTPLLQYLSKPPSSASQTEGGYSARQGSVRGGRSQGNVNHVKMCDVCHVRPRAQKGGKVYPTCGFKCAATLGSLSNTTYTSSQENAPTLDPALLRSYQQLSLSNHNPGNSKHSPGHPSNTTYTSSQENAPTLDPALLRSYQQLSPSNHSPGNSNHSPSHPSRGNRHNSRGQHSPHGPYGRNEGARTGHHRPQQPLCVVCRVKPCRDSRYVTCGIKCSDPKMCDYCHRRPKLNGYNQCGKTCRDNATTACLLCRCRPRFGRYHLCGRTCKTFATTRTPLILEARPGHTTYTEVEKRFKSAWKGSGTTCPPIKKIYKIIENKSFLLPYDQYKKRVGHEVFRYHGTSRKCNLGSQGNTQLCSSTACALCSILRTSFKVSLASPSGAFGPGIYTSSAANKAYNYSNGGTGAIILTKVVLGTVYNVQGWNQVMSCPQGHNSVVFDRQNGTLNETIVYTDDAIRPVYLIIF